MRIVIVVHNIFHFSINSPVTRNIVATFCVKRKNNVVGKILTFSEKN